MENTEDEHEATWTSDNPDAPAHRDAEYAGRHSRDQ